MDKMELDVLVNYIALRTGNETLVAIVPNTLMDVSFVFSEGKPQVFKTQRVLEMMNYVNSVMSNKFSGTPATYENVKIVFEEYSDFINQEKLNEYESNDSAQGRDSV